MAGAVAQPGEAERTTLARALRAALADAIADSWRGSTVILLRRLFLRPCGRQAGNSLPAAAGGGLLWIRTTFSTARGFRKMVVHGHTPGASRRSPKRINIDTEPMQPAVDMPDGRAGCDLPALSSGFFKLRQAKMRQAKMRQAKMSQANFHLYLVSRRRRAPRGRAQAASTLHPAPIRSSIRI